MRRVRRKHERQFLGEREERRQASQGEQAAGQLEAEKQKEDLKNWKFPETPLSGWEREVIS